MGSASRPRLPAAFVRRGSACLFLAFATLASGQGVVKCIDAEGNITYQDSPCTGGQKGRPVELPKAETREDTSAWEAAANGGKVTVGMPKRWVLRARGAPAEIRPGGARDDATEVWRYVLRDGAMMVGFAGPNVAWVRDESLSRPGSAATPAPAAAATGAPRGAQNRRFVIAGRYCEHVFAEIGAADREEALPAEANAAAPAAAPAGKRYFYEPQTGDPSMRTVFSCIDGRVADVERTLVR
jgi:hypothetical protein